MSRPKITVVGVLRWKETDGLGAAILEDLPVDIIIPHKLDEGTKCWIEPLLSFEGPPLEKQPDYPRAPATDATWAEICAPWFRARSENESYRRAAWEYMELQNREPHLLRDFRDYRQSDHPEWKFALWCYKEKVLKSQIAKTKGLNDKNMEALFIKQFVLHLPISAALHPRAL